VKEDEMQILLDIAGHLESIADSLNIIQMVMKRYETDTCILR